MKKFSKNIKYDEAAYYMSCPESIANYLSNLLAEFDSAVELCSAIGITCIALAKKIDKVYGIELDSKRIDMSNYNAKLYGVEDKIEFIQGNVLDENVLKNIKANVAILDPDWSIDKYNPRNHSTSLNATNPNALELFKKVKKYITSNIVLRVYKNISEEELQKLGKCHIHNIIYGGRIRFKYAFYFDDINENKIYNDDFNDLNYE